MFQHVSNISGVFNHTWDGGDDNCSIFVSQNYQLMNIQKAIDIGPVEIVDWPINSMVDLSINTRGYQLMNHKMLP